jgi:hypothetical protein
MKISSADKTGFDIIGDGYGGAGNFVADVESAKNVNDLKRIREEMGPIDGHDFAGREWELIASKHASIKDLIEQHS